MIYEYKQLGLWTIVSEFDYYWVPYSLGFVLS